MQERGWVGERHTKRERERGGRDRETKRKRGR